MSYEPTNWKNGDVITAQKLNKLEQGVAGSDLLKVQIITRDDGGYVLTLSWQDIYNAVINGLGCIFYQYDQTQKFYHQYTTFHMFQKAQDEYVITIDDFEDGDFSADSPDGFPGTPDIEPIG